MTYRPLHALIAVLLALLPTAHAQQISSEEEIKRLRDINFERQVDAASAPLARHEFEDYRGVAKEANDRLAKLLKDAEWLANTATNVLTDDDGKRIAAKETSVTTFQELFPNRLIPVERVRTKKKISDMILAAADAAIARADEGKVIGMPSGDARQVLAGVVGWMAENGPMIESAASQLRGLIADAPKDVDLANAPTLQSVLDYSNAKALEALSEAVARGKKVAQEQSDKVLVEAAYLAELKKSNELAKKTQTEADIEVRRIRTEYEDKLRRAEDDERRRMAAVEARNKDLEAELDSFRKAADVARHEKKVQEDAASGKKMDAAEKARKTALAQSTEVQGLLKPFTTPGYHQWRAKDSMNRQPVSLKALQSAGALDPSTEGLNRLLDFGLNKADKERPRFGYPNGWNKLNPGQKEELKKIQGYLIELGEVMVELGMLSP